MKKTLLVILLIASVITGAFAADTEIMLGLQSGFNQQVNLEKGAGSRNYVPVKADAMFYFGDSFALNAALGMDILIPEYGDATVGMGADVLAYYRCELSDMIDILAGGGLSYKFFNESQSEGGYGYSSSMHYLALLGSVRFQFDVIDHLTVFAGADVGYNIMNAYSYSMETPLGNESDTDFSTVSILPWAIKAGVSYKF